MQLFGDVFEEAREERHHPGSEALLILQRIAMTIHDSLTATASPEGERWAQMTDEEKAPFVIAAKKVLGALRGPSHRMLADGNLPHAPSDAGNIWERMIFRALYEQED